MQNQLGGRGEVCGKEGKFLGQRRGGNKLIILGREDVFFVHPQNGLNNLILNWCIGGCWFTLAILTIALQGLEIMKKNTKFGHPNGQLKKQKFPHHMKIIGESKVGVELGPHYTQKHGLQK
jgi:hypothetical protein